MKQNMKHQLNCTFENIPFRENPETGLFGACVLVAEMKTPAGVRVYAEYALPPHAEPGGEVPEWFKKEARELFEQNVV